MVGVRSAKFGSLGEEGKYDTSGLNHCGDNSGSAHRHYHRMHGRCNWVCDNSKLDRHGKNLL